MPYGSALVSTIFCDVGAYFLERRRRLVRIETGPLERGLVVVEHRVRHVERHRPQHLVDAVVVDDPLDVVAHVVLVGVDARLRGQHGSAVDHVLQARVLALHEVGQLLVRQPGGVPREVVLVARRGRQRHLHLVLRRVVLVRQLLELVFVRARHRVPERDVDRTLGLGERVERALGQVRCLLGAAAALPLLLLSSSPPPPHAVTTSARAATSARHRNGVRLSFIDVTLSLHRP